MTSLKIQNAFYELHIYIIRDKNSCLMHWLRLTRRKHTKMPTAWYLNSAAEDQRLANHRQPPEFISLKQLYKKTGVELFKINLETVDSDDLLLQIKKTRGYTFEDEVTVSKEHLPNYEEKVKSFFVEHLHPFEETRLILEGSGYFDARDISDEWIRIQVLPGDLIILPSGLYQRFTMDTDNYIKARRYFLNADLRTFYNRPAEELDCRKAHLEKLQREYSQ